MVTEEDKLIMGGIEDRGTVLRGGELSAFTTVIGDSGGRNSSVGSVLGSLSCVMQHIGFNPPLRKIFPVEGIFPLELTWVLTPQSQNSFG